MELLLKLRSLSTLVLLFVGLARANAGHTENVFLVTLDGLRWQELFSGAELNLIDEEIGGVADPRHQLEQYWHDDSEVRKRMLMPFFWRKVATKGQVFGAPEVGSSAIVKNGRYFSYPGYQEILCGFPDDNIDSNDKIPNPNVNVLEWLNRQAGLQGKVAAFASWDVFPYILNASRSGIYVNAGWQDLQHGTDDKLLDLANRFTDDIPHYWTGARFDALTMLGAMEYLRTHQPRVLYLALDETDDWCHSERYDLYLDSARRCDKYLKELWSFAQNSPHYRGKTSMVITTDHGRGDGREGWKNHSTDLPGSERIWIAVIGPDTPALGLRRDVHVTQGQVAATVAALLGYDYADSDDRIADPLPGALTTE